MASRLVSWCKATATAAAAGSPWLSTVTLLSDKPLVIREPTYKAEVIVNGVRVRGLLDHEAQVFLVCKELE